MSLVFLTKCAKFKVSTATNSPHLKIILIIYIIIYYTLQSYYVLFLNDSSPSKMLNKRIYIQFYCPYTYFSVDGDMLMIILYFCDSQKLKYPSTALQIYQSIQEPLLLSILTPHLLFLLYIYVSAIHVIIIIIIITFTGTKMSSYVLQVLRSYNMINLQFDAIIATASGNSTS